MELTFIPTVQIKTSRHWELKRFSQEHVAGLSGWGRTRTQNMCVHYSSPWTPSPGALVSPCYHIHHPVPPNALSEILAKSTPPYHACPAMSLTLHILWSTCTHGTTTFLVQSLLYMLRRCQWFSMTYLCPGLPQSTQIISLSPPLHKSYQTSSPTYSTSHFSSTFQHHFYMSTFSPAFTS